MAVFNVNPIPIQGPITQHIPSRSPAQTGFRTPAAPAPQDKDTSATIKVSSTTSTEQGTPSDIQQERIDYQRSVNQFRKDVESWELGGKQGPRPTRPELPPKLKEMARKRGEAAAKRDSAAENATVVGRIIEDNAGTQQQVAFDREVLAKELASSQPDALLISQVSRRIEQYEADIAATKQDKEQKAVEASTVRNPYFTIVGDTITNTQGLSLPRSDYNKLPVELREIFLKGKDGQGQSIPASFKQFEDEIADYNRSISRQNAKAQAQYQSQKDAQLKDQSAFITRLNADQAKVFGTAYSDFKAQGMSDSAAFAKAAETVQIQSLNSVIQNFTPEQIEVLTKARDKAQSQGKSPLDALQIGVKEVLRDAQKAAIKAVNDANVTNIDGSVNIEAALSKGITLQTLVDSGKVSVEAVNAYVDKIQADLSANYTKLPDGEYIKNTDLANLTPELREIALSSGFEALSNRIQDDNKLGGNGRIPPSLGALRYFSQQGDAVAQAVLSESAYGKSLEKYKTTTDLFNPIPPRVKTGLSAPLDSVTTYDVVGFLRENGNSPAAAQFLISRGFDPSVVASSSSFVSTYAPYTDVSGKVNPAAALAGGVPFDRVQKDFNVPLTDVPNLRIAAGVVVNENISKRAAEIEAESVKAGVPRTGGASAQDEAKRNLTAEQKSYSSEASSKEAVQFAKLAAGFVPVVGTVVNWNDMSPTWKGISIGLDALALAPVAGGAVRGARAVQQAGRLARISGAAFGAGEELTRVAFDALVPIYGIIDLVTNPIASVRSAVMTPFSIAENILSPAKLPEAVITTSNSTVRLAVKDIGSAESAKEARDILASRAAMGDVPVVEVAGQRIELAQSPLMKELGGGLVHATPQGEAFEAGTIVLPKTSMPSSEQGLFVSNEPLPRFVGTSAFGKTGNKPVFIITSPETAKEAIDTGKIYAKTVQGPVAEIEQKFPIGVEIPQPKQKLYTRVGREGVRVEIWLEKPLTPGQIIKLKAQGLIEGVKTLYTPSITIERIGESGKIGDLAAEAKKLDFLSEGRGITKAEANALSDELAVAGNERIARTYRESYEAVSRAELLPRQLMNLMSPHIGNEVSRQRTESTEREPLRGARVVTERTLIADRGSVFDRPDAIDRVVGDLRLREQERIARDDELDRIGRVVSTREPLRETLRETNRDVTREPSRDAIREPVRGSVGEPVRDIPREPLREIPREPTTSIIRVPPTSRSGRMRLTPQQEEARREEFRDAIAWRQGFVFWAIKPPYQTQDDVGVFYKTPPPGAKVVKGGAKSAYRSIQSLTGKDVPVDLTLKLGIQNVRITSPGVEPGKPGGIEFIETQHNPEAAASGTDINLKLHEIPTSRRRAPAKLRSTEAGMKFGSTFEDALTTYGQRAPAENSFIENQVSNMLPNMRVDDIVTRIKALGLTVDDPQSQMVLRHLPDAERNMVESQLAFENPAVQISSGNAPMIQSFATKKKPTQEQINAMQQMENEALGIGGSKRVVQGDILPTAQIVTLTGKNFKF